MVAGAAYLITDATSIYGIFVRSSLIVSTDAARTASNIAAHAQQFRVSIVFDVLTGVGVVILNLAFYELLAPIHRSLARLAAFWRLAEVSVGGAIAVSSFMVLSLLTGAEYVQAFQPRELQALVRLFVGAQESGYLITLLFAGLGSTTYMYLLVRSRYIPKALALLGLAGSVLIALFALTRMLFPAFAASAFAAVRSLPVGALAVLAVIVVPILGFEIILGLWLLVKGVRIPEQA
jgi:hypothetical protein